VNSPSGKMGIQPEKKDGLTCFFACTTLWDEGVCGEGGGKRGKRHILPSKNTVKIFCIRVGGKKYCWSQNGGGKKGKPAGRETRTTLWGEKARKRANLNRDKKRC